MSWGMKGSKRSAKSKLIIDWVWRAHISFDAIKLDYFHTIFTNDQLGNN